MHTDTGKAYGKLNLYLGITGVREDGYHTIETVFQSVGIYDSISLSRHNKGGISLRTNKTYLPNDNRNLAWRSAQAFFDAGGIKNSGLYINIKKELPVGAGMAGGSADAAAVLRILNKMYAYPFNNEQLCQIGLSLGADVPYCIKGGTALATSIGENLSTLPQMPKCHIVICKPPFSVSAKQAYALYDEISAKAHMPIEGMLSALQSGNLKEICFNMYNALEEPVAKAYPDIAKLKNELLSCGAIGAMMTGSGSAVFGVFASQPAATMAAKKLSMHCREVHITRPL